HRSCRQHRGAVAVATRWRRWRGRWRAQVLAAQRAALGSWRRGERPSWVVARVVAGVVRVSELPVIRRPKARAVTAADVQRTVGTERDRTDGVTRELLAPVLDEDLLSAVRDVAVRSQPRQAGRYDAPEGVDAGRTRARVGVRRRSRTPLGSRSRVAENVVVRVEHVQVWIGREV